MLKRSATLLFLMLAASTTAFSAIKATGEIKGMAPGDEKSASENTPAIKYWKQHRDGWWWYKDPPEKLPPEEAPKDLVKRLDLIPTVKELREEVDKIRDRAIIKPTEENIRDYLYAQKYIMDKSTVFAEVWRQTVWKTPDVDYSLARPVNASAIYTYTDERHAEERHFLTELANNGTGIFFIFSSTCPYCKQMSPTLKNFEKTYGIRILPITLDGGTFPEFPDARMDNGTAKSLGIETVPAMFLASPRDKKIAPIGFGVLSLSELVERINVIMNSEPGKNW